MRWISILIAGLILLGCNKKAHGRIEALPVPSAQVVSRVDTIYDTLRVWVPVGETLRVDKVLLTTRYDTLRNLVQITQVRPQVLRTDTVTIERSQVIIQPQTTTQTQETPKGITWHSILFWSAVIVVGFVLFSIIASRLTL